MGGCIKKPLKVAPNTQDQQYSSRVQDPIPSIDGKYSLESQHLKEDRSFEIQSQSQLLPRNLPSLIDENQGYPKEIHMELEPSDATSIIEQQKIFFQTERFELFDDSIYSTIKIKKDFQMDQEMIFSQSFFPQKNTLDEVPELGNFKDVSKYEKCIDMIKKKNLNLNLDFNLFNYKLSIGKGGQGSVYIVFWKKNKDQIPLAQKKIVRLEEFQREATIISKINSKSIPTLISIQVDTQSIFMECCICSLKDLKPVMKGTYLSNNNFFTNLLLTLMKMLNELIEQNLFHGDVKPQNIGIALREKVPTMILLDFGGSSWNVKDYGNCYTKGFCCQKILDLINKGKVLNFDEIRYAEFYSACRTIQYLMVGKIQFSDMDPLALSKCLEDQFLIAPKIMKYFFDSHSISFTKNQFEKLLTSHQLILSNPIILNKKEIYDKFCILKSL